MSKLLVEELFTSISEGFTLSYTERTSLAALYPHLYIHNEPAGTFTITLKKGATNIFSKSFNVSDIKATIDSPLDYSHVWYPVIPTNPVQIDSGEYLVELTSSGYTFSESAYIGWCRNFEEMDFKGDFGKFNDEHNDLQLRLKVNSL